MINVIALSQQNFVSVKALVAVIANKRAWRSKLT